MFQKCAIALCLVLAYGVVLAVNSPRNNATSTFHRFRRQTIFHKREATEGKCRLPGSLQNGRYYLNPKRCPPDVCILAPGALIPTDWDIFYECDDGYVSSSSATTSICKNGRWSPELPTCYACGSSTEVGTIRPLIANGQNANIGTFPWHAGLYFPQDSNGELKWVQQCGGVLINPHFVVTAAHCVVDGGQLRKKEDVRIALGKYYRPWDRYEDNAQKRNVRRITFQQNNYNKLSLYFDIALIMMDNKVEFGRYVMPVCTHIPFEPNYILNNKLFVAGWGLTESGKASDILQYTDVSILPREDCATRIPSSYFLIEKLCTHKNNSTGVAVREGDSGGGLTVVYKGHHYIVGIVSLNLNQVTLFTDIGFSIHKVWIEKETNSIDTVTEEEKIKPTNTLGQGCAKSETTAKGKEVCRGEVIFEDNFSQAISDKWGHYILISENTSNIAFSVYDGDEKHAYIKDGSLVIKPTVYDEAFVTSGILKLKGCTDPGNCERTATADTIFPPVATAWMHTYDSFYFRYGKVEIRAKLPVGDWLSPELEVRSRFSSYGSKVNSGYIRIVSRGNSDLKCNGNEAGRKQLELWIEFGPKDSSLYRSLKLKNLSEGWHDQYHIFTVIWKPGSISFEVDDELVGQTSPGSTNLCENFGFKKEDCDSKYGKGSTLAPFDKEFFLRVGMSVGNTNYLPDSCISKGKPKPWKNNEPQSRLQFWQDRNTWQPTWTEEGSSLYVDYIRVTAL